MARVMDPLKAQAAEAALALRGHLQFLAELGVEGLPRPTVKAPVPKLAVPVAAAPRKVAAPPAPAPAAPPPTEPTGRKGNMPWDRHLPPRGETPAAAPPPPPPPVAAPPPPPPAPRVQAAPPPVVSAPPLPPPPPVVATPVVSPLAVMGMPLPPANPNAPRGAEGLRLIREDLGDCKRCKLHSGRTNLVFGVGNPAADICFVGEGPGADEDLQGEPFVGRAGQLLNDMIKAMGLARGDVYICNVVKCRPPNNRDPEPDEVAACSPFLIQQVRAVRPKVLVTLGKHAAHSLLGTKTPITRLRGTWGVFDGIPLMPTFHPSYLLRDPTQKKFAWEDLKAVLARLGRGLPPRR